MTAKPQRYDIEITPLDLRFNGKIGGPVEMTANHFNPIVLKDCEGLWDEILVAFDMDQARVWSSDRDAALVALMQDGLLVRNQIVTRDEMVRWVGGRGKKQ
jgi:hypothetical protein